MLAGVPGAARRNVKSLVRPVSLVGTRTPWSKTAARGESCCSHVCPVSLAGTPNPWSKTAARSPSRGRGLRRCVYGEHRAWPSRQDQHSRLPSGVTPHRQRAPTHASGHVHASLRMYTPAADSPAWRGGIHFPRQQTLLNEANTVSARGATAPRGSLMAQSCQRSSCPVSAATACCYKQQNKHCIFHARRSRSAAQTPNNRCRRRSGAGHRCGRSKHQSRSVGTPSLSTRPASCRRTVAAASHRP